MRILSDSYVVGGVNGEWRLDIFGDTHLGTINVDEDRLKADIAHTKLTGRNWVHVGDAVDGIVQGDRRFNEFYKRNLAPWAWTAYQNSNLIQAQWDRFEKLFDPIADRGLVVLSGDGKHNEMKDVADCFQMTLSQMNIPGGFPACFLMLSFKRGRSTETRVCPIMLHHGWFTGRTSSSKVLNLQKALNTFPTVWSAIVGHGHDKVEARLNTLVVENGGVTERVRRAAMTGSYLKTYEQGTVGYGEIHGYPPVAIGKITLVLRPFHGDPEKRVEFENM